MKNYLQTKNEILNKILIDSEFQNSNYKLSVTCDTLIDFGTFHRETFSNNRLIEYVLVGEDRILKQIISANIIYMAMRHFVFQFLFQNIYIKTKSGNKTERSNDLIIFDPLPRRRFIVGAQNLYHFMNLLSSELNKVITISGELFALRASEINSCLETIEDMNLNFALFCHKILFFLNLIIGQQNLILLEWILSSSFKSHQLDFDFKIKQIKKKIKKQLTYRIFRRVILQNDMNMNRKTETTNNCVSCLELFPKISRYFFFKEDKDSFC
ncbi:hypothetical protein BpHYR1_007615 [Brachionus plicatilis]|uniref:Uncharacterized protein n=1 Tax=Brachionus plicatilis TaxID=10195 RepID=A0A3M7QT74_BRAPC|nr:hypothetical protein BpHYR1_007615 [Brachionus plicatilis]